MTFWLGDAPLILASQSRARQMLLASCGLEFEAMPADIDERALQENSRLPSPRDIALLLAREKARTVSVEHADRYVIGADQTLALGDRLFSKPADPVQAAAQLALLAGHTHELHSAVAIARNGNILFDDVSIARMTMRPLRGADIATYLEQVGERITTSVGAYQLEHMGVHLFERIDGDHFTILGLPLLSLLAFLRRERLLAL
ncbi:MAG: septum formation protein Maf [Bradyrhizobium sp.]|uniref:Maf family nucleotide pyrophosphatase n=1 Tax=Bradyrhizobium sp. TaxID=376 RepID=UPI0025BC7582|nr:Maf family nucleotide pyrophosphatase [Bradyrhizobium sp.]MBI5261889.1 septum formation protein Maf [Bradyrhizobium sp.]